MNHSLRSLIVVSTVVLTLLGGLARADSGAEARKMFASPPREYATAPLWVWGDLLTEEQVVSTLRDLAAQQVRQAIVHPRPGLATPYLSPEWFRLWKAALAEAERLNMNLWIYDENSYPSGFAGGFVPDAMPESRGLGLHAKGHEKAPAWTNATVAVFRMGDAGYEDVSGPSRAGETLPDGKYLAFTIAEAGTTPWLAGKWYVNLLMPGVTEKFLEITLEPYLREVGHEFGRRIPGVFTDEPYIRGAGGLPWARNVPDAFEKRWGYSLLAHLPSLTSPVGDFRKVRHDYVRVLHELFVENWARPYHDWCEKHKLEFTGHYWEHEWPQCLSVPDNMAMYAWHQRPAIDVLMNRYDEGVHAQFGNARIVRELASVANQLGRRRTLCEVYGAGGWDLRFEDMKRIGDWMYALGVNTMDEHLSYISIRGARKHDHPQSFSYHTPWWNDYSVCASYFTRLSAALSQGEQVNSILVIQPTTTAWIYNPAPDGAQQLGALGGTFQKLVLDLEKAQVEYDLGSEDIIGTHGSVEGQALVVGKRKYTTVVIPDLTETLNTKTMDLLDKYAAAGGVIIAGGQPPTLVDGRASDRGKRLAEAKGWSTVAHAELPERLLKTASERFSLRQARGDKGLLFHHRRMLADGELLFLVNTSIEAPSTGTLRCKGEGIEQWDPATGEIKPYRFMASDGNVGAVFELPPCGSLLLFISRKALESAPSEEPTATQVASPDSMTIRRVEPNVLTLDYVDVTAGGESKKDVYVLNASNFVFQKHGFERNPWDRAVQFKDELIRRTFPSDSGFEVTYRFTIEEKVPAELAIVIERPDLYTVTCNGKPVQAGKGAWWLDKAFGRIDIRAAARVGENAVTLKGSPFSIFHELDCAYVLGDFALKSVERGFVIVPPGELRTGAWNTQGHPFYAAGVSYTQKFTVEKPEGTYRVSMPKWYGSVARVSVNGKPAGHIAWAPWQCDVTPHIKAGSNEIAVVIVGTLKNTLGPHHGNHALGSAWPAMWDTAPESGPPPGASYSNVAYGLMEPFKLECVSGR